jgi:hypothetical protein
MANTYTLIDKVTLNSQQSSVSFTGLGSYSSTYTDLLLMVSARQSNVAEWYYINFNSSSSSYTNKQLYSSGSGVGGDSGTTPWAGANNYSSSTANTFSNNTVYIPNFSSSNNKSIGYEGGQENSATAAYTVLGTTLWSNTAAITSITLYAQSAPSQGFVSGSSFYLYGIKNS